MRKTLFLLALCTLLFASAQPASAQLGIKKALKKQAEKVVDGAANGAGDAAAEKANDAGRAAVEGATKDIDLSGGASGSGSVSGGGSSAGGPVDFRELRALLPEAVNGKARTDIRGERAGAFGIKTSKAEAEYGDDLKLIVTDMGTLQSAAMLGFVWMNTEVDNEDDNGYERTTKFKDYPAYEKLEKGDYARAEMQVVVGQRFVVSAESEDGNMDAVKSAIDSVDLSKLAAMAAATSGVANASSETADFNALKALLPASLPGLNRTEATGQKNNAMGMKMSMAEGKFSADGMNATVTITDMGSLTGLTTLGYVWLNTEIDTENDNGYERTTKIKGHPGREKLNRSGSSQYAELEVVVGGRYMVSLKGNGVPMETLKAGLDQIDLDKLAAINK